METVSKEHPSGHGDRLFTLPKAVVNVDDIKRFVPHKRDLQPEKLLKRLGTDFNSFWMSVHLPEDLYETIVRHGLTTDLEEDLNRANLTSLEAAINAKYGSEHIDVASSSQLANGILDVVMFWLVQKASCPTYYIWEDLGILYWPRWVRRGFCSLRDTPLLKAMSHSEPKTAKLSDCSWPPGMHCVPGKAKQLKILLWQCRNKKSLNNFDRFRLPGMDTTRSFPKRSKRQKHINKTLKHINNSRHSNMQLEVGLNGGISLASNQTSLRTHTNTRRQTKGNSQTGVDVSSMEDGDLLTTLVDRIESEENHANERTPHEHQKQLKRDAVSTRREQENDGNETENWNSKSWKQRRRALDRKCKWIKIPYPVTDDCFCSC